ncbi:MAG: hypothetical protein KA586_08310 [Candidatus Promineofilum sp.]|nr:hypothetical protein [Promineifilum sp.]
MSTARVMTDEEQRAQQKAALDRIRNGLATRARILVSPDACPVCRAREGAYAFEDIPELPLEGCSRPGGCNAVYEPVLDLFGP